MEMLNVWLIWYVWTELAFFGVKKKKEGNSPPSLCQFCRIINTCHASLTLDRSSSPCLTAHVPLHSEALRTSLRLLTLCADMGVPFSFPKTEVSSSHCYQNYLSKMPNLLILSHPALPPTQLWDCLKQGLHAGIPWCISTTQDILNEYLLTVREPRSLVKEERHPCQTQDSKTMTHNSSSCSC